MSRWARDVPTPPLSPPSSSMTVEQALMNRLTRLREALIDVAGQQEWDEAAVDGVLDSAGLEPWTREYVVTYEETAHREVRVRARNQTHASAKVALGPSQRMTGVRAE